MRSQLLTLFATASVVLAAAEPAPTSALDLSDLEDLGFLTSEELADLSKRENWWDLQQEWLQQKNAWIQKKRNGDPSWINDQREWVQAKSVWINAKNQYYRTRYHH